MGFVTCNQKELSQDTEHNSLLPGTDIPGVLDWRGVGRGANLGAAKTWAITPALQYMSSSAVLNTGRNTKVMV